jgi:YbbR domain-containing protein
VGQLDVDVRVQVLSEKGVKVVQVEPVSLSVELKPVVSQLVPVVADVVGSPPIGYEAQPPVLSPEQVLVSGPEDLVARVKSAVATVNLSGAVGGVRQSYSLVARDDRGFIVAGVSLEPSSAAVEIVVEQKQFERLVAVSPSLRGSPVAGYNVTAVEVDPPSVTLLGPIEILNVTSVVLTDDIDISGASSDLFRTVALRLPTSVSISGNATVSVRVRIAAAQGEATFGVAPTVSGLGSDLRVASITPLVEVLVQGELPLLRSVIPDQVEVSVDLTGLAAGTHLLEPHVKVPPDLQAISTSPATVEVVLESTLEPPPPPNPHPSRLARTGARGRRQGRSWPSSVGPTSASLRCSTASSAHARPSSRTSPAPPATGYTPTSSGRSRYSPWSTPAGWSPRATPGMRPW